VENGKIAVQCGLVFYTAPYPGWNFCVKILFSWNFQWR